MPLSDLRKKELFNNIIENDGYLEDITEDEDEEKAFLFQEIQKRKAEINDRLLELKERLFETETQENLIKNKKDYVKSTLKKYKNINWKNRDDVLKLWSDYTHNVLDNNHIRRKKFSMII